MKQIKYQLKFNNKVGYNIFLVYLKSNNYAYEHVSSRVLNVITYIRTSFDIPILQNICDKLKICAAIEEVK